MLKLRLSTNICYNSKMTTVASIFNLVRSQFYHIERPPLFAACLPWRKVPWAETYLRTKWHLDVSSCMVTIEMRRKLGRGTAPFLGRGGGFHLTQSRLDRGLPPYQVESWSMQPFARNRYGPKLGGVPLWVRGSPSNTMWPGSRPTCVPSFILIRPTVWPQWTNVTDRQDRQTDRRTRQRRCPIAYGEPFYKRSPKKTHCDTISGRSVADGVGLHQCHDICR